MADFLVYNKKHYADVYMRGDIIECRPDGYFDKVGFDKDAFIVVQCPAEKFDEKYNRPEVVDGEYVLKSGKKYSVNSAEMTTAKNKTDKVVIWQK
jgi:hypothetical protein